MRVRKLYRWAAACAASLMLFISGMTAFAAQTGTVRINDVNVRTEASAESERVCKLPINTNVDIVDQAEGSDGKVWYSVTFMYEGAEKAGWIRSDMLTVSETEDTPEDTSSPSGGYSIIEPEESYAASDALVQTGIQVGEESFTAWQVSTDLTGGSELYLVYASKPDGSTGWCFYDPQEETFQRDLGQFSGSGSSEPEGLITALQDELTTLKESSAKQLSQRLYVIIGLGALSAILLILVIVFGVKYRNAEYEYYDDDDEDENEEDSYDGDESFEEKPAKRRGLFSKRRDEDEDDEQDDFDDFLAAVKRKQAEPEEEDFSEEDFSGEEDLPEEEEKPDLSLTDNLPEIDMSAVLEVEEEAEREKQEEAEEPEDEDDELPDFDIEILDLDDLDL